MISRIAALGLCALGISAGAAAQVTPDATLGTNVSQAGQTYTISGGTIVGGTNQFHSFQQFDLASLQIADFTGAADIQNILSRVTGPTASTINGTIRSSIDGANLWIINPNGVVFGAGSALDVSGSFHVSTADYLLLEGGGRFFADPGGNFDPLLLVGNPTTFGFLEEPSPPPCFNVNCLITVSGTTLEVPAGQSMTFAAGEVRIESATLRAPQGRLNLASVGSAGEITLLTGGIDNSGIGYAGDERVYMTGNSTLDVSGPGGSIYIRGGSFLFGFDEADDETILAVNSEATDAGVIDIDVVDRVHLQGEIRTDTNGAGNGADISIAAREFGDSVRDSGIGGNTDIVTATSGSGNAGSIFLSAEIFNLNADISTGTTASGNAGSINIDTTGNSLSLAVGSVVTGTSGSGRGGDINITTTGDVFFGDGDFRTSTTGTGDAGNITLAAQNIRNAQNFSMTSDTAGAMADAGNGGYITFTATAGIELSTATLSSSTSSSGAAGTVRLEAPTIVLTRHSAFPEGVTINTDSAGAGSGGNIELVGGDIEILDDVLLTATARAGGTAGTITIDGANSFAIGRGAGSSIETSTTGTGGAGNIDIRSGGLVDISGDAQIRSESLNATAGSAGSISIAGRTVQIHNTARESIDDPAAISVQTASDRTDNLPGSISISATDRIDISHVDCCPTVLLATTNGASDGGDIKIFAPVVAIDNSRIRVATNAAGNGGSVSVTGSTSLDLFGSIFEAGTRGTGQGGDIVLAGGDVTIDGATDLLANTFTDAQAGNIEVSGNNVRVQRAFVEVTAGFEGTGGNVHFNAADQLTVGGTARIIATTLGSGDGGNVSMDAASLTITDDAAISVETEGTGNGGTITLSGANLLVDGRATVSGVTLGAGAGGNVLIDAGDLRVQGEASLSADTLGPGAGGDIAIFGVNLTTAGSGRITASTSADGAGGNVSMDAASLTITDDAAISVETAGAGSGGTITLSGANVLVDGRATVSGVTSGAGDGGNMLIDAGDLRVQGNASLSAGTLGPGAGGDIAITGGSLTASGSGRITASTSADGAGGGITLAAHTINLGEDSQLSVTTSGPGSGGTATLTATNVTIGDRAGISASTTGAGNGGTVLVTADELLVQGGGSITASTGGAGNGGDIAITGGQLTFAAAGRIAAGTAGAGAGGSISLQGDVVNVTDGASISATTASTGSGGNVDVSGGTVTLAAGGEITASSAGAGVGGSIAVAPIDLLMEGGARIAVSASETGNAGSIVIDAGETILMTDAAVESLSAQSDGGDVVISAGDLMYLTDSSVTTSADSISGSAGNIRLGTDTDPAKPAFLIMQGSTVQANAGATGGAINIHSQYLLGGENVIEAISDTGNDGAIVFDVPATDFVSVLSQLDAPILNISELLQDQCAVSALKERSSFVSDVVALPPSPESYLSSGYYLPAAIARSSGRYRSGTPASQR